MRNILLSLAVVTLGAGAASAQTTGAWADKIFLAGGGKISHDFGTVARGAQLAHSFTVTNIYNVPLEITDIRVTCGCVKATPTTRVLKPQEKTKLNIVMDSSRFSGPKSVTVYVTVGPEYISTASISLTANARPDVVLNPGQINFGVVRQGQTPTQVLDVEYAGSFDWRVTEVVKSAAAPYEVAVEQRYREPARGRQPGRAGYRLTVTLRANAPAGPINQELVLKTNEPAGGSQFLTVPVEGNVQAALSVSPGVVNLGRVKVGSDTTYRVQVRGDRPFRILKVDGADDVVSAVLPAASAQNHVLELHCRPRQAGDLRRQLIIRTDLDQSFVTVSLEARVSPE
jgi:hypothetical protein